jgi:hypothetical protein
LPIENETFRGRRMVRYHSFDKARFEPDILIPGVQEHHCPNRIREGDTGEETANMLVIPYPSPLEIRELCLHLLDTLHEVKEGFFGAIEGRHGFHTSNLPMLYGSCVWRMILLGYGALSLNFISHRHIPSNHFQLLQRGA